MDARTFIITLISALLGSTALSTLITTLGQRRISKANAHEIESRSDMATVDFVQQKMKELCETYRKDTEDLRKENSDFRAKVTELTGENDQIKDQLEDVMKTNKSLRKEIKRLNKKIQSLMDWILNENASNINDLKDVIRGFDPDYEFKDVPPCPNVFDDDDDEDDEEDEED